MGDLLLISFVLLFILGTTSRACLVVFLKRSRPDLHREVGEPRLFSASFSQIFKIQRLLYNKEFSTMEEGKVLVFLLRLVAVLQILYLVVFINLIIYGFQHGGLR